MVDNIAHNSQMRVVRHIKYVIFLIATTSLLLLAGKIERQIKERTLELRTTACLDEPVTNLNLTRASVSDIFAVIRQSYHAPISYIAATPLCRVDIHVDRGTVGEIVD